MAALLRKILPFITSSMALISSLPFHIFQQVTIAAIGQQLGNDAGFIGGE
ncbi:MAG: hypothetical protein IPK57_09030 [Chitinophagaceae bacterium]|nr:hypothetical protein [Chitinophagaceae bacterium]